jgi:PAS domain S-box/diguanylate cyclase (GGDEF) domain
VNILPQAIIYAITFFFAGAIFIFAWPRRKTPGGTYLLWHLVALEIWVLGLYFEAVSETMETKILWSQISYLGFTATVPFFFLFVLTYTNQTEVKRSFAASFFIVPFLTDIAAWTNQWHHLLWTGFHWGSAQFNILIYDHGIIYFLHIMYIYTLVFFGLGILLNKILKSRPPFRSQLIIIFVSGLFPLVSGTLYAFNINLVRGMDTSSFGFLMTDIMLSLGFARYQLLDLVPVARDTLIRRVQDGMIVVDWKSRIVEINKNAIDLLKITAENPIGLEYQSLIPWPLDLAALSKQNQPSEFSFNDGEERFFEVQVSSLTPQSATPSGYLLIMREITSRKRTEVQLKQANVDLLDQIQKINHLQQLLQEQATHDSLTGLYNRRLTDEVLNHLLEQSQQNHQPLSILIMDIDYFKTINDQYGHQVGDALLQEYGACILAATRKGDFSCRLGGDEILIAFQNMPLVEAEKKADHLRKKLHAIVVGEAGQKISTTVSIGIAVFPSHGATIKELISRADHALYAAKESGRDRIVLAGDAGSEMQNSAW